MNYQPHISELDGMALHFEQPEKPVFFLKPDSALASDSTPFFLPDFAQQFDYECELVVRISKLGKNIAEKFAHRYYDAVTLGLDMTARDLQRSAKSNGLPWAVSKGFDQSAIVGTFIPVEGIDPLNLNFRMTLNGQTVQQANTSEMIFSIDALIAEASRYFTLKTGDLLFSGTPSGVGPVHIGDTLDGYLEDRPMFHVRIK